MTRRFTVIQGGRSDGPVPAPPAAQTVRVDLCRPASVEPGAVAAWRGLMIRADVSDPLRDPDHLLPLAQHRPAGARLAVALAWSREADGAERLRGAVPLALPHPVWGRGAEPWQPAEAGATALVEAGALQAVDAALRRRLAALRRPLRLVGALDAAAAPAPTRPRPVGRPVPADALLGVRPDSWEPPAEAEAVSVSEPAAVRDAVEAFLALDARTAAAPIVHDPAEASLVRVVSRLFARRRACRVEVFRRAGEIVAGALHLGAGPVSVAWRRARA